jgi:glycosyltransferase involved in cell wall biosynthesis
MIKPIRILQVFAQMNRGGAETMIMNLYRKIDRSKVQFDFMVHTNEKCVFDDEIQELGGKIFRVPAYNGKNHICYKKSWEQFFNNHSEYNTIHGHVRSTASIYLAIAKKNGLITIAHSHSTSSGAGFSAIVKNLLQYPIRYIADYLFACSETAGVWLFGKKACKKNNFYILNNAIDAKIFIYNKNTRSKVRREFRIDNNFVIGHIGRFNTPKNHKFLIEVFKTVYDQNNNVVLMLVGDGELRHVIEKKVEDLGLMGSVIFTGVRSDISELLQAMDIFVFPSLYEGLGIAVIEAQAAGLPCIVANTVPREAYVTNLVESLSLKASKDKWADRILKICNDYERINTYEEIKINGYDIKETGKFLERFYLDR